MFLQGGLGSRVCRVFMEPQRGFVYLIVTVMPPLAGTVFAELLFATWMRNGVESYGTELTASHGL